MARIAGLCLCLASAALLAGCASGDFGRVRPSLVADDIHDWIGTETAQFSGHPASHYPLTDDERLLRDLAYPLIAPPYDQKHWYSVVAEYGAERFFHPDWWIYDRRAYAAHLMGEPYRSASARYAQLIEDARDDIVRVEPFFSVARRILDMDNRRAQSLALVAGLSAPERVDALARIGENRCVIQWVERSLVEREAAYRYALEHLVIAEPSASAAEADRVLTQLGGTLAANQVLPPLVIARPVAVAVARVIKSDR